MPASVSNRVLLAKLFSALVIALGVVVCSIAIWNWQSSNPTRGYLYLLMALIASGLKFSLPRVVGAMSVNFVFVLIGVLELSLGETLLIGCSATLVQVMAHRQGRKVAASTLFHVGHTAIAVAVCYSFYHSQWLAGQQLNGFLRLAVAAALLYVMNMFPIATVTGLMQHRGLGSVWKELNLWSFPYYLAGAILATLYHHSSQLLAGQSPILLLPVAFLTYFSYHSYVERLAAQKAHGESMAALHLRTIEALAVAIEAKDMTAQNHLRRLQLYCVEIGKDLGIAAEEMEGLRAAAVLHDIGKLAVPEHILCKPGKLTKEEFEKIKIHPVVGAQILERVNFPYPVARIVKSHHEKWNGGGYPQGLKGEAIPIGARILAVADCLDALITERPYRSALPLKQAVDRICAEGGISFDPAVVAVLKRRYLELEAALRRQSPAADTAGTDRDVATEILNLLTHTAADSMAAGDGEKPEFLNTIAAARHEAHMLLELTHQLGNSLHLEKTFPSFAAGLKQLMSFDALVIYELKEGVMKPRYSSEPGVAAQLTGEIPLGQGLTGWAVKNRKPVINANPELEFAAAGRNPMQSAMVVPLSGLQSSAGAIMVCRRAAQLFTKDNLRVLLALSPKLGVALENGLMYEQAAASATTDYLTGLPNARALQLQLESEMARAIRTGSSLTVIVTDLNGFKQVNDRFGHLEGNAVLCAVGKALRLGCREYDYVGRMGGDEFVLLLPGLAEQDVQEKISQMELAAAEAARTVCPEAMISLSAGQARYPEDGNKTEQLLSVADQRMYQAKQAFKRKITGEVRGFDFDWLENTNAR
jgi:diguanylate cyclase (GGDEF)-like protein/putative nucleotidyltransferase with HDIG domain